MSMKQHHHSCSLFVFFNGVMRNALWETQLSIYGCYAHRAHDHGRRGHVRVWVRLLGACFLAREVSLMTNTLYLAQMYTCRTLESSYLAGQFCVLAFC